MAEELSKWQRRRLEKSMQQQSLEITPEEAHYQAMKGSMERAGLSKKLNRKEKEAFFGLNDEETERHEKEIKIGEDILERLKNPLLIEDIKNEISKDHLEDDNVKMTVHLTHVSGLLKNPKRRQSFKLSGKTSVGKDNCQLASLKHLPEGSNIFITSGTQSVMEDDVKDIPIIAISELNLQREGGANKFLLEVIKQRTEGGTTAIKKDVRENNKKMRLEKGEQGTVTYGTTEAEDDEELGTRTMQGEVKATPERIKIVNDNTLKTFSDENKLIAQMDKKYSWIKKAYTYFWKKEPQYEIVIPYAKYLSEKIDDRPIFDNSDARSQRDIKRLLSLTCAMTWIYQEQREKKNVNGIWFLVSEPIDLINTLKFSNEFFNQTYTGFDSRISNVLKFIRNSEGWVDKIDIQKEAGVKHRDTINGYLWALESQGFIERSMGGELNADEGIKLYKGNHAYYRSVQKAFSKCLISVQLDKLEKYLNDRSVQISVQNKRSVEQHAENKNSLGFEIDNLEEIERLKMNTCETCGEELFFNGSSWICKECDKP